MTEPLSAAIIGAKSWTSCWAEPLARRWTASWVACRKYSKTPELS